MFAIKVGLRLKVKLPGPGERDMDDTSEDHDLMLTAAGCVDLIGRLSRGSGCKGTPNFLGETLNPKPYKSPITPLP